MEKVKVIVTGIISTLMSWLGMLFVPVFLLVGFNVIDYFTGIIASKYRKETVSSYKGMKGIIKKVCMWLLILVGAMIDTLISYAATTVGLPIKLPYIVATVVAVWLICNEIISVLENLLDIGVEMPAFLMQLAKNIKKQVEDKTNIKDEEEN